MAMERRTCVVPVCRNERFHLVHKFPMQDARAEMWRRALNIPELMEMDMAEIRHKYLVCSRHFKKTDYKNISSRSLNWNAVPSKNLTSFDDTDCYDSATFNMLTSRPIDFLDTKPIVPYKKIETPLRYIKKVTEMGEGTSAGSCYARNNEEVLQRNPDRTATKNTQVDSNRSKEAIPSPSQPTRIKISVPPRCNGILRETPEGSFEVEPQHQETSKGSTKISTDNTQPILESCSRLNDIILKPPEKRRKVDNLKVMEIPREIFEQLVTGPKENNSPLPKDDLEQILTNIEMETETEMTTIENSSSLDEDYLVLPGSDTRIDFFWLRDHCRCTECYNYSTNQRKLSIRSIPLDISPKAWAIDGDMLTVTWPDGHESQYSLDVLQKQTLKHRKLEKPSPVTWNRDSIQRFSYARVSMCDYLVDDQVSRSVVQSLVDYGVAFVEKVPANATFTEIVIKRLFAIHRTHFGELWTFSDGMGDHLDTAYTSEALPAHTDNTYFNDASGLQVLHCIDYKAKGGSSLLVDGFNVLQNLKLKSPDTYERLKRYQIPAENKDKVCHHTHCGPIITEDPVDGKLQQIRYNNPDRAYMNTLPQSEMRQFYGDLQILAAEIEDPANEFWFQLKPGTVMFFDNWRLLHGRSEFSGKRVMSGSYVSRTEFMSVARTMKIVP